MSGIPKERTLWGVFRTLEIEPTGQVILPDGPLVATAAQLNVLAGGRKVVDGTSVITGSGQVTAAGLGTITSVVAALGQDASSSASTVSATSSGNTVTLKVWAPTSSSNATPVPSTSPVAVNWQAAGTP